MKALLTAADRKFRDLIAGLVDALHVSRVADARRIIHRHRQLLDDGCGELPLDMAPIRQEEDIPEDAHQFDKAPCGYYSSHLARG